MRTTVVALTLLAAACTAVRAGTDTLRARVTPRPTALAASVWTPTVTVTKSGEPTTAALALTIRKGSEGRTFRPRATRRGTYRALVTFPSDGHWRWTLTSQGRTLSHGALRVGLTFQTPYDLAVAPDGSIYFVDTGRVLLWQPATRHVTLYARTPSDELSSLVRTADGTIYVADIPGHRILRVDTARRVTAVASIRAPGDITIDPAGTTLWAGSIEDGVYRVDLSNGHLELIDRSRGVHGLDRDSAGNLYVHDANRISRIDAATGTKRTFSELDGIKLLAAPDGSVYASAGDQAGGRIYRITPDGTATPVVGTGLTGPHRDGRALDAQIGPFATQFAPDGALLVTQTQPIAAIRRVDLATGTITTLVRGD